MQTIQKTSFILIALGAALAARAQSAATPNSSGLLGQRYVEVSGGAIDPHQTSDTGFTAGAAVNLPIQSNLDVGFGYTYGRLNGDLASGTFEQRARDHTLLATTTVYSQVGGIKPFASAALGYAWAKDELHFGGTSVVDTSNNQGVWGLALGAEIPFSMVTVTPRISYQDGFRHSSGCFVYDVAANVWFTKTVGAFADVAFSDPRHASIAPSTGGIGSVSLFNPNGGTEAWTYRAGVRFRF